MGLKDDILALRDELKGMMALCAEERVKEYQRRIEAERYYLTDTSLQMWHRVNANARIERYQRKIETLAAKYNLDTKED